MGKYETTFAEYEAFAGVVASGDYRCGDGHRAAPPTDEGWGQDRRPVINVSWEDATCYALWLSFMTGQAYRLPSEAEWEYAARAGTPTRLWWGDKEDLSKVVCSWCTAGFDGRDQGKKTAEVDDPTFEPNAWGLYHTAGNVWEWVQDCFQSSYQGGYQGAPMDGSAIESKECDRRVFRGGSWLAESGWLRSAARNAGYPEFRYNDLGFRLAHDLEK